MELNTYDFLEGIDALITAYTDKDPATMEDDEYIHTFRAIDFRLKCEEHLHYRATKRAFVETLNEFFSKTNP